jgi:major membrane immunogen (membrane-anchored lipoprotein)
MTELKDLIQKRMDIINTAMITSDVAYRLTRAGIAIDEALPARIDAAIIAILDAIKTEINEGYGHTIDSHQIETAMLQAGMPLFYFDVVKRARQTAPHLIMDGDSAHVDFKENKGPFILIDPQEISLEDFDATFESLKTDAGRADLLGQVEELCDLELNMPRIKARERIMLRDIEHKLEEAILERISLLIDAGQVPAFTIASLPKECGFDDAIKILSACDIDMATYLITLQVFENISDKHFVNLAIHEGAIISAISTRHISGEYPLKKRLDALLNQDSIEKDVKLASMTAEELLSTQSHEVACMFLDMEECFTRNVKELGLLCTRYPTDVNLNAAAQPIFESANPEHQGSASLISVFNIYMLLKHDLDVHTAIGPNRDDVTKFEAVIEYYE